jgi:hypothetical protein
MNGLEEQAVHAKARDLYWKPLSWLGTIRPMNAKDSFDQPLWETFVVTTLGLEVPVLSSLLSHHYSPRPHKNAHSSLRCNHERKRGPSTPTCLGLSSARVRGSAWASLPLGWTQGPQPAWTKGKRRPTARRRGDLELPARPSWQPELGLRPHHHITHERFGSSSHVQQNGHLTHPQDMDAPFCVLRCAMDAPFCVSQRSAR